MRIPINLFGIIGSCLQWFFQQQFQQLQHQQQPQQQSQQQL
jgi:hypothetical protein